MGSRSMPQKLTLRSVAHACLIFILNFPRRRFTAEFSTLPPSFFLTSSKKNAPPFSSCNFIFRSSSLHKVQPLYRTTWQDCIFFLSTWLTLRVSAFAYRLIHTAALFSRPERSTSKTIFATDFTTENYSRNFFFFFAQLKLKFSFEIRLARHL